MSLVPLPRTLRGLLFLALALATGHAAAQECETYDEARCGNQLYSAESPRLLQWCEQGTDAACSQLLREWDREARQADPRPPNADPDLQEPAVCKENTPDYDADACMVAAEAAASKAIGMALVGIFDQREVVLPAARRETLQRLCLAHPKGEFCRELADAQWKAEDYTHALEALQAGCRAGDARACELHAPLQALGVPPTPLPATALPCGEYRADGGLLDTLDFGDGGLVGFGLGTQARARLEDGTIRLRHDRGSDFAFRLLPGGRLVGMDQWTRMRVYQRSGGSAVCTPPVTFNEIPLPRDCPQVTTDAAAEACCAAGKLQGCNARGNQLALAGDWVKAASQYRTVCQAGVREGCENLVSAQENSPQIDARAQLTQLCTDGGHTHVACDLLATRNWALLEMGRSVEAAQSAADHLAQPQADPPRPARTRNHKQY